MRRSRATDLEKDGLVQWPMVMGGIVPVVNLDGIAPGELLLDGPTLADIFQGTVKAWDDAAIKKLNPAAKLPSTAIAVVHRSDGSGTTFNFTDYLSKVSADWQSKVGSATAVEWPVGIGAKGNEGVANNVANTKNSIGYVEYAYAKQNKLTFTKLVNKDGKAVSPVSATFQAAAANADWTKAPGFYQILTNQPGADSWPITAATFILMHKKSADAGEREGGPEVLRLGLRQGRPGGRGARLHPDALQRRHAHPEGMDHDHGRERQAAGELTIRPGDRLEIRIAAASRRCGPAKCLRLEKA